MTRNSIFLSYLTANVKSLKLLRDKETSDEYIQYVYIIGINPNIKI